MCEEKQGHKWNAGKSQGTVSLRPHESREETETRGTTLLQPAGVKAGKAELINLGPYSEVPAGKLLLETRDKPDFQQILKEKLMVAEKQLTEWDLTDLKRAPKLSGFLPCTTMLPSLTSAEPSSSIEKKSTAVPDARVKLPP